MAERTGDGRPLRMVNLVDEYSRECVRIRIDHQVKAADAVYELSELFIERGVPEYVRSDNGSEFTSAFVRDWLRRVDATVPIRVLPSLKKSRAGI